MTYEPTWVSSYVAQCDIDRLGDDAAADMQGRYAFALLDARREIEALEAERDRLREALEHVQCKGCGSSPATDPAWRWAYGESYRNGHVYGGPVPDLCGPVEFVPFEHRREA